MLQFPISFWNTISEGKTPTDKDQCEMSTWFVSILQPHRPEKPFRKLASCRRLFEKRRPFEEKVGLKELVLSARRWVLIDTEPSLRLFYQTLVSKKKTQVDLSNLGYSQLSSKLGGPDSTRFRTCGSSFFGELQQSCSSMVEIVAWSA